jgi:acetyl esterase/lipase
VCTEPETLTTKGQVDRIANVSVPTLSVYEAAASKRSRPALLVCPGGAYQHLSFNKEGTEIAAWLNTIGYTAAVLKYRVPENRAGALQDAQRAMGLLRHNAKDWGIDPNRIGVLGCSAGGHLSASLSTHTTRRNYPAIDAADEAPCRPDFTVLVYPAYLDADDSHLVSDIPVTAQTPPAFIVQTQDDRKYGKSSTAYYLALTRAGVPAELHLFPTGGHGYGLRPAAYPVTQQWPELCEAWMNRLWP